MKLKSAKDGQIIDTDKMSDVLAMRFEKAQDLVNFGLKYNQYFFLYFIDDNKDHSLHVNLPQNGEARADFLRGLDSRISDVTDGKCRIFYKSPVIND